MVKILLEIERAVSRKAMLFFWRAKHWQLFLFFLALPFAILMVEMMQILPLLVPEDAKSEVMNEFYRRPNVILANAILSMSELWYWTVGYFAASLARTYYQPLLGLYRVACWLLALGLVYLGLQSLQDLSAVNSLELTAEPVQQGPDWVLASINFFLAPFAVYSIFVAAKALATLEEDREVTIPDYFKNLLALLFFPIGVWFIQPRVNGLYYEYREALAELSSKARPDSEKP